MKLTTRMAVVMSTMLTPLAAPLVAHAENAVNNGPEATISEVVVTAQKRQENLQKVPMSVTALSTETLRSLKVEDTGDVIKFLPSVSFTSQGPGYSHFFFRGVASGENFNHSGSQPTVGVYLDEQPITTVTGELDVHMYDIARIEALAGPQGTLYGSSSEAGTLRIITNQPKLGVSEGRIDLTGSVGSHGQPSGAIEGFDNVPIGDHVAVRLVGWYDHDGGYIDNVERTTTYPSAGITANNANAVKKDFNDVTTYGGRAALRVELGKNWTIDATLQGQDQLVHGVFGYDKSVGMLKTALTYLPHRNDRWVQAGMTIQGKIGSVDVTYAGSYLNRRIDAVMDYADYSYFYDSLYGEVLYNNAGHPTNPAQYINDKNDRFYLNSQELRIATDHTKPLRLVAGLFYEEQEHQIPLQFTVPGLATAESVPGYTDVLYLTREKRVDRDYAAFGELSYDITPQLTLTGGGRVYRYDNTLVGFIGYGFQVANCFGGSSGPALVSGTPCTDLGVQNADGSISPRRAAKTGTLHKLNLSYTIDPNRMVYFTWSTGYRPGGINRAPGTDPYQPDYLTNYELGFKTAWFDNRLRVNGAFYYEDWSSMQFSYIGANDLTVIANAGDAHVKGFEYSIEAAPTHGLTISTSGSINDAELAQDFCARVGAADCSNAGNSVLAPSGTQLPVTPRFKGVSLIRYEAPLGGRFTGHIQGSVTYQTSSRNDLRTVDYAVLGTRPGYALVDAEIGLTDDVWSVDLFAKNLLDNETDQYRYTECTPTVCGGRTYAYVQRPRQIGLHIGRKF